MAKKRKTVTTIPDDLRADIIHILNNATDDGEYLDEVNVGSQPLGHVYLRVEVIADDDGDPVIGDVKLVAREMTIAHMRRIAATPRFLGIDATLLGPRLAEEVDAVSNGTSTVPTSW